MSQANGDLYGEQIDNELKAIKEGEMKYKAYRESILKDPNKDNCILTPEMHLMSQLIEPTVVQIGNYLSSFDILLNHCPA